MLPDIVKFTFFLHTSPAVPKFIPNCYYDRTLHNLAVSIASGGLGGGEGAAPLVIQEKKHR